LRLGAFVVKDIVVFRVLVGNLYNLLYGISKFPLIYVSSPQGERMEVRGLSSCMEFQSLARQ